MNGTKTRPLTILSAFVFAGCVALLDVLSTTPLWTALYVIPVVWIALWSTAEDVRVVSMAAIVVTGFDFLPCFLPHGERIVCDGGARLIALGAIWLTVLLALSRKKSQRTFRWISLSGK